MQARLVPTVYVVEGNDFEHYFFQLRQKYCGSRTTIFDMTPDASHEENATLYALFIKFYPNATLYVAQEFQSQSGQNTSLDDVTDELPQFNPQGSSNFFVELLTLEAKIKATIIRLEAATNPIEEVLPTKPCEPNMDFYSARQIVSALYTQSLVDLRKNFEPETRWRNTLKRLFNQEDKTPMTGSIVLIETKQVSEDKFISVAVCALGEGQNKKIVSIVLTQEDRKYLKEGDMIMASGLKQIRGWSGHYTAERLDILVPAIVRSKLSLLHNPEDNNSPNMGTPNILVTKIVRGGLSNSLAVCEDTHGQEFFLDTCACFETPKRLYRDQVLVVGIPKFDNGVFRALSSCTLILEEPFGERLMRSIQSQGNSSAYDHVTHPVLGFADTQPIPR
jgi:hypothetical protein